MFLQSSLQGLSFLVHFLLRQDTCPQARAKTMNYSVILTDEDKDTFTYEEPPEIYWELFQGIGSGQ